MTSQAQENAAARDEVESVRARNPIDQVIGSYVELTRAGRLLRGLCPFHADKDTPSLVVYAHNQSWWCFGCSQGGDVFKFVELIERVSFKEAFSRLGGSRCIGGNTLQSQRGTRCVGDSCRTPPPAPDDAPILNREASRRMCALTEAHFTLLTAATEVYHAALLQQPAHLAYLAKRGFNLDAVRKYRLGYAAGNNLEKYFRFRGWDPETGEELGLLVRRNDGDWREYFDHRIIIPELRAGPAGLPRAVYLVGRATETWQKAKYLGLPGAPKPLFGGAHIRDARTVFVTEGPFDWLTLVEWGYAAVAVLGAHLKREHEPAFTAAQRIYMVTQSDEVSCRLADNLAATFGARVVALPPLNKFKSTSQLKDVNELMEKHPQDGSELFARLVRYAEARKK